MKNYNVAFRATEECGGYEGVITWTSFESKEAFQKWYTEDIRKRKKIVEEGITPERAVRLSQSTPIESDVASCFQAATMRDGTVNHDILEMQLANVIFARALGGRGRPLSDDEK